MVGIAIQFGVSPYLKKRRWLAELGHFKALRPSSWLDKELGHPATMGEFLPHPSRGRGKKRRLDHVGGVRVDAESCDSWSGFLANPLASFPSRLLKGMGCQSPRIGRKTQLLCSSLLLTVPIGSFRSLASCDHLASGDWKKVEVVLLLCSVVLPYSLLHLCACVVLCSSGYCPPWPGVWAPCCAVFLFLVGDVDVSHGLSSGSSISVNLPLCRLGREQRYWFSGTELRVR
jgi:hypothetical protein